MKKLTLSAEDEVIKQAKHMAERDHTSVSAMFSRFIRSLAQPGTTGMKAPPGSIAAKATGLVALPKGKSPRDVLAEALMDKYGTKK